MSLDRSYARSCSGLWSRYLEIQVGWFRLFVNLQRPGSDEWLPPASPCCRQNISPHPYRPSWECAQGPSGPLCCATQLSPHTTAILPYPPPLTPGSQTSSRIPP